MYTGVVICMGQIYKNIGITSSEKAELGIFYYKVLNEEKSVNKGHIFMISDLKKIQIWLDELN